MQGPQVVEPHDIEPQAPSHLHRVHELVFSPVWKKDNGVASEGQPRDLTTEAATIWRSFGQWGKCQDALAGIPLAYLPKAFFLRHSKSYWCRRVDCQPRMPPYRQTYGGLSRCVVELLSLTRPLAH